MDFELGDPVCTTLRDGTIARGTFIRVDEMPWRMTGGLLLDRALVRGVDGFETLWVLRNIRKDV